VLAGMLDRHGIVYEIEEQSSLFNPTFYADETAKDYEVKISPDDFIRVSELLKAEDTESVEAADSEHYLFKFTNEELKDLLGKPDEWSSFDYLLALKILKERGVEMNEQTIAQLNEQRLNELKKAEPPQTTWIVLGYICAILGGLIGIFIGWHLANSNKTLPTGEKVYSYNDSDRAHGKRIFYLAIAGFLFALYMRIAQEI
jgi:hypothetical protein